MNDVALKSKNRFLFLYEKKRHRQQQNGQRSDAAYLICVFSVFWTCFDYVGGIKIRDNAIRIQTLNIVARLNNKLCCDETNCKCNVNKI